MVTATTVAAGAVQIVAPSAAAYDIPVLQWNMQGGCSGQHCGQNTPAQFLAFLIGQSTSKPWVITLNEVCLHHNTYLSSVLPAMGYTGEFRPTNWSTGSACQQHGNAVWYLGAYVPNSRSHTLFTSQTGEADIRTLSCVKSDIFGTRRAFCVTHLTNGTSSVKHAQDEQAFNLMNANYSSINRMIGADRNWECPKGIGSNACPRGVNWAGEWADYKDVDPNLLDTHPTPNPNRKIDWFRTSSLGTTGASSPGPTCGISGYSDHCMVGGSFSA